MPRTTELDMANTVATSDIDAFLTDTAWAIHSTYHTVWKASPGAAIFGRYMLFDIPFLADWKRLETTGNAKQTLTQNTKIAHVVIVLLRKDGILCKSESRYECDPWTITTVHTNRTIRVQRRSKSERLNIRRVTPFLTTRFNSHKCYFY